MMINAARSTIRCSMIERIRRAASEFVAAVDVFAPLTRPKDTLDLTASMFGVRVERLMAIVTLMSVGVVSSDVLKRAEEYVATMMADAAAWSEQAGRSAAERAQVDAVIEHGAKLVELVRLAATMQ